MAVTINQLIAEYAEPIADIVGLTATDYESSAGGLANLLCDAADRLSSMDQTGEWLTEAAAELNAIDRLGGTGKKTQKLLNNIDSTLYEAKSDLELC